MLMFTFFMTIEIYVFPLYFSRRCRCRNSTPPLLGVAVVKPSQANTENRALRGIKNKFT